MRKSVEPPLWLIKYIIAAFLIAEISAIRKNDVQKLDPNVRFRTAP
jgi:hypothetical protein